MSAYNEVELTHEQMEAWETTNSMMLWTCPGFRHLWTKLLAEKNKRGETSKVAIFTKDIPNACTDGLNIVFNPDWFFSLKLAGRVFVAGHEILHNVYRDVEFLRQCQLSGKVPMHDGTTKPFDNAQMQQFMDWRINALLIDSKIGAPPLDEKNPFKGNFNPKITPNMSLIEIYGKYYKKKPDNKDDGEGEGDGSGSGGFDELLPPGSTMGKDPDQAVTERNEKAEQWTTEVGVAAKIEAERKAGKMAASLARMFAEILEPEIPWIDHIETLIRRKTGSGGKTWKRPDRRFIAHGLYLPTKTGFGAGHIVVWGDTSGSIQGPELNSYIGELSGIIADCAPQRLTVLWCDAAIHYADELETAEDLMAVKCRGTGGGGGTCMQPVMEWIGEQDTKPEVLICFTDGYVTFPKQEPSFPVIWASVLPKGAVQFPFGDVVYINKGGK